MFDKELKFSEKYNWWSKNKNLISKKTKISYIMAKGDIYEIFFIFKNFKIDELKKGFDLIKKDNFILKSRRKGFLKTLFQKKKEDKL